MIDIKAFTEEDGTAVKIKELNGSINEIIEETAATVATIVIDENNNFLIEYKTSNKKYNVEELKGINGGG